MAKIDRRLELPRSEREVRDRVQARVQRGAGYLDQHCPEWYLNFWELTRRRHPKKTNLVECTVRLSLAFLYFKGFKAKDFVQHGFWVYGFYRHLQACDEHLLLVELWRTEAELRYRHYTYRCQLEAEEVQAQEDLKNRQMRRNLHREVPDAKR